MKIKKINILFILTYLTFFSGIFCQSFSLLSHQQDLNAFHQSKYVSFKNRHNLRTHEYYSSSSNSGSSSFLCFLIGPILFLSSFAMIWFNQKRAVIDHRRLKLAQQICQDVNPFRRDQIIGANMKLTHITGNSTTRQIIGDKLSGVSINNALKIIRTVQVMEWRATTTQRNGHRQINYHLGWQSSNQQIAENYRNSPSNWFIKPQTIYNNSVYVGQYVLSSKQLDLCQKANPINLDMNNAHQIINNTGRKVNPQASGEYIYFPSQNSNNINDHGALRIKYTYCPVGPISIMGKTIQNKFQSFPIAQYQGNGIVQKNNLPACCCLSNCIAELLAPIEQIHLVDQQLLSRNQMIENSIKKAKTFTLIIRILSFIIMVVGLCMFFTPITNLLGYFPIIGGLLKMTLSMVILIGAFLLCLPLYIITISIAWLFYHPKVGLAILGIGIAILLLLIFISKSQSSTNSQVSSTNTNHFLSHFE